MDLIYFIAGLVILGFAGEATLRGAVGLAQRLNISPAMIGLTVVGLGTSLPELVVCVEAALDGKPDLAVGNIVGSNISNILLILGVGALIFPLACDSRSVRRDGGAMIIATLLCAGLGVMGYIPAWAGLGMLALFAFLAGRTYATGTTGTRRPSFTNAKPKICRRRRKPWYSYSLCGRRSRRPDGRRITS